ncbi:MAG: MerR family transcriptional regulator [Staphylococcus simulans]|uniref:MerR family transcriptional regulator n=1 Tax=Staphylococcus TaxID=1279 RepID=UPI0021086ACB|nr:MULTISPECIES: MerR family transcriptional regulator [Staphylococcus]MDK7925768.1 MerR family transcriptional regulator [Staphylococcus simulans]MDK8314425.1 MerR family transcriptional regulator [Staphylococcus simulans]
MICFKKYSIQEVSEMKHISKSKLRYYEKHGLLMNIERNANNQRVYSETDIEIISLIQCLSLLNMPLKKIKYYVEQLNENKAQISDVLEAHLKVLKAEKDIIEMRIDVIEERLHRTKITI